MFIETFSDKYETGIFQPILFCQFTSYFVASFNFTHP